MPDSDLPSELLVVLSMHRSGSSALTRALSLLGHALPKTLIKDNASNRRGHWESQPLARLNDAYLKEAGLVWSDWTSGTLARTRAADRRDFEQDLRRLVADEFPPGRPAVVKEPRICRLLPSYRAAFEESLPLRAVVVVRNPLEVKASLVRRNNLTEANAALLWLRYTVDALVGSEGLARAFVAYDQLLDTPLETLGRLQTALGGAFPMTLEAAGPEIQAFLSGTLRNHSHAAEEVVHHDLTHGWISDAYAALRILTHDATAAEPLATIARIRAELDTAEPMLGHIMGTYDAALDELRRRDAALSASVALKTEQVRVLRDSLSEEKAAQAAVLERQKAELEEARDEAIRARTADVGRLRKRAEAAEAALAKARAAAEAPGQGAAPAAARSNTTTERRGMMTGVRRMLGRGRAARPAKDPAKPEPEPADTAAAPAPPQPSADDIERVERSGLFDTARYLRHSPAAASFPGGAIGHYLAQGWRNGRDPGPSFRTRAYTTAHADLLAEGECPLLHFLRTYPESVTGPPKVQGSAGRIAVFTAIVGDYDILRAPFGPTEGADFFAFTDGEVPEGSVWQHRALEYVDSDPARTTRFVKTHPHLYFADYDVAIWMDGNVTLNADPRTLLPADDATPPILTWHHPLRDCVYEEGEVCVETGRDDADTIRDHLARLERAGIPRHGGLFETSVIVTRLSDPRIPDFYAQWWAEIEQGSRRDQLSLPHVIRESGLPIATLAPKRICMRTDPRFVHQRHEGTRQAPNKVETAA
ncbi:MAG: glycosyltransferase domain-containing protein [Pseudomonadota bacterium]